MEVEGCEQDVEVGGEGVVVETRRWLAGLAKAAPIVGDDAVAGRQQCGRLLLPGVPVEEVAVDEHHRLTGAVVFVVQLDVGSVFLADGHVRHGVAPQRSRRSMCCVFGFQRLYWCRPESHRLLRCPRSWPSPSNPGTAAADLSTTRQRSCETSQELWMSSCCLLDTMRPRGRFVVARTIIMARQRVRWGFGVGSGG